MKLKDFEKLDYQSQLETIRELLIDNGVDEAIVDCLQTVNGCEQGLIDAYAYTVSGNYNYLLTDVFVELCPDY